MLTHIPAAGVEATTTAIDALIHTVKYLNQGLKQAPIHSLAAERLGVLIRAEVNLLDQYLNSFFQRTTPEDQIQEVLDRSQYVLRRHSPL